METMVAPRLISDPERVDLLSKPLPRVLEHLHSLKEHGPPPITLPVPLHLMAYKGMRCGDIIISVEHCYHCSSHMSLKHDPSKYESMATQLMQSLEMTARECKWLTAQSARITGLRVPIHPKHYSQGVVHGARCVDTSTESTASAYLRPVKGVPMSTPSRNGFKYNEYEQRTGALEIQVACKHPRHGLLVSTLHSKLAFRKWPGKVVLKRLTRFLNVCEAIDKEDMVAKVEEMENCGSGDKEEKDQPGQGLKEQEPEQVQLLHQTQEDDKEEKVVQADGEKGDENTTEEKEKTQAEDKGVQNDSEVGREYLEETVRVL